LHSVRTAGGDKDCCWEKGVTPDGLAVRIGVGIPEGATDLRAAVKETITSHLGKTALCPEYARTPEGRRLRRCVDLCAHEFAPGRTRIYARSTGVGSG